MKYIDYGYIKASKLGVGTSSYGSKTSKRQALKILKKLEEHNINYIDTAISYGLGYSESIVGDFIHKSRERYFISTKVGIQAQSISTLKKLALPLVRTIYSFPFLNKAIKKQSAAVYDDHKILSVQEVYGSIQQSLKNLRTDYIDQLLIHNNCAIYLNNPAVLDLLNQYKEKGIIRHIGITTDTLDTPTLSQIHKNKDLIKTIQIPFTLMEDFTPPSVFVNYFSIFTEKNQTSERDFKQFSKEHTQGHFIVLMNSEKHLEKNLDLFAE
jgi:aryl-alcohol dehydrogenase-like predicted oxidoreductase